MLVEGLDRKATPWALGAHRETVLRLGQAYEQINASFGALALKTLEASTTALTSTDEGFYEGIEDRIADLTQARDALAAQIKSQLDAAAFAGKPIDERHARYEILDAWRLVRRAQALADVH